ncbi:protein UXT isoform X2 [Polyodon spathula]|uniref:protein UXT isoform X2 n=1 Tax=Polyodon spathula TaxID=7913 RepID=UPI001B7F0677|nr:protein UXT isoform X2 [Polyodon spathula]
MKAGAHEVDKKVLEYETFVTEVLKRDLKKVLDQRDEVSEKIAQYLQLKNVIQSLQESECKEITADVDLGCNFYVQTKVEDSSRIFVSIGYGFFVEFTLPEALRFIDKKTKQLTELKHLQRIHPKLKAIFVWF